MIPQIHPLFCKLALGICLGTSIGLIFSVIYRLNSDAIRSPDGLVQPDGVAIGGDFFCFYAAGQLFRSSPKDLYNLELQRQQQRAIFKTEPKGFTPLPFVYPPLVAAALSLLSYFSFQEGYLIWSLISAVVYTSSILLLCQSLKFGPRLTFLIVIFALSFMPYSMYTLLSGHLSVVGMAIATTTFVLIKKGFSFWAGVIFSLSYYKPPIFLLLLLFLLWRREWAFIQGFFVGAISLAALSLVLVPIPTIIDNFNLLSGYHYGSTSYYGNEFWPKFGAGLLAFFTLVAAPKDYATARIIFALCAAAVIALWIWIQGSSKARIVPWELQYSAALSVSLLLSLQMVTYDISLLACPMLLTGTIILRHKQIQHLIIPWALSAIFLYLDFMFEQIPIGGLPPGISTPMGLIVWTSLTLYLLRQDFSLELQQNKLENSKLNGMNFQTF